MLESFKPKARKIRRNIYEFFNDPKYSKPGLFDLTVKLEKYLSFRKGFFIEVGANDGYNQSNTYYLEKFLSWSGVLVEPIPDLFEECRKSRKRSFVYDCALAGSDFHEDFIEMHYANLRSMVEGSLKDNEAQEAHIKAGLETQNISHSYKIRVPVRTLESILDELSPSVDKIDFFSLDVEGFELNVLKGLNLEKYKPNLILVESNFFQEINDFLEEKYILIDRLTHHDYLYKLRE
jgi:FkbM family methyltransferase